ncbi:diaminobutyrate acetyltransferase [Spiribacter vilamensis]|uniref:diaminobutyrate acetyltransferase n=1 Tax=Spiribacter vilamensis TaxID=531306 RepID=UPI00102C761F|nr:diaminobutyrate acetyltransferase [Spiribacter vilamensis]TVO61047.1 diaminobutyrate acetyltransferase [Spiribacter vilamensis]
MIDEEIPDKGIRLRSPTADEGGAMWTVARDTQTLDLNSSYLYMLLARDFADTCVIAEHHGRIVGFASGYRRPRHPEVVFLWQVGIRPGLQGQGLGKRLIAAFLRQPGADRASMLETTIAPDNEASRALFQSMARELDAECRIDPCFRAEDFPDSGHPAEELFTIGPYRPSALNRLAP